MKGKTRAAIIISVLLIFLVTGEQHSTAEKNTFTVLSTKVICKETGKYIGWPTIAKTADGELFAVFSGDRDEHVCPWGKTEMVRSSDNGKTWTEPVVVNNTPLDDRDAGIIVTKKGTILVSWFTSLAFDDPRYLKYYPEEITKTWKRHSEKLSPEIRKQWLGCWVRRSTDSGRTWEKPIRVEVNSPHGPIELYDGRILYVGRTLWAETVSLGVIESRDDGKTWQRIGTIPIATGENIDHYHELHAVECGDGKIIAMIRYQPENTDDRIMRQTESYDGGRTWTTPHPTGIWGLPPHLIRLRYGKILIVYGHRREPYGERARISLDSGKTWDSKHDFELASALNGDLGYPASVQLDDGSIFTVYYQIDKEGEKTCLMGTLWRIE